MHANFQPPRANVSGADQNARHRHGQDLVRNAVDVAHRLDQANARLRQGVWSAELVRLVEAVIDPADEVAIGDVANEQVKTVGNLIQMPVSQGMGWQRAGVDVSGSAQVRLVFSYRQSWKCQYDCSFGQLGRAVRFLRTECQVAWP